MDSRALSIGDFNSGGGHRHSMSLNGFGDGYDKLP
jgi:hypothetical protein